MQPFEKHPAKLAELEECGLGLWTSIGNSIAAQEATRTAYRPAVTNWNGQCAPEITAAPGPFETGAEATRQALAWAAVVVRYWGAQVRAFNDRVDAITAGLHSAAAPSSSRGSGPEERNLEIPEPHASAEAAAKRQWWEAYESHIVDGRRRAALMLRDGPTRENVAAAISAGALDSPKTLFDHFRDALRNEVVPPESELMLLNTAAWWTSRGFTAVGAAASYMADGRRGRFAPRSARGRYTSPSAMPWYQRGLAAARSRNWQALPGRSRARAWWSRVGRIARWGGAGLAAGTGALDQWLADSGRADLSDAERVGRTAYRGMWVGAGAWGGAKAGAAVGLAIGSVVPGLGTAAGGVVGAIAGGLIGGVTGSALGDWITDQTVDAAGDLVDWTAGTLGDGTRSLWELRSPDLTPSGD